MKAFVFFLFAVILSYGDEVLTERNVHGFCQPANAPHLNEGRWSFSADFLYWQAQEDGLELGAHEQITIEIPSLVQNAVEKSLRLNFDWDPGFRASLGFYGDQNGWDLFLTYTYMHNVARVSKSIEGQQQIVGPTSIEVQVLTPDWFPFALGNNATTAKAHWRLNYNVLDLAFGRNYFISRDLAIHPFCGVRGASIDQNYDAHYSSIFSGTQVSGTLFSLSAPTRFKAENDFYCAGIRGGTDLLWHWASHFALLGKVSGSVLYGKFHVKDLTLGQSLTPLGGLSLASFTNTDNESYWRTRANLEGYLGLQWEAFFGCSRHIALNLGYEISHWFQQNELNQRIGEATVVNAGTVNLLKAVEKSRKGGDLGLQGLTFNCALDY